MTQSLILQIHDNIEAPPPVAFGLENIGGAGNKYYLHCSNDGQLNDLAWSGPYTKVQQIRGI